MPKKPASRGATEDTPCVLPTLPLELLETMRDMDRPDEVLEGEELSASMPRRLGLSDIVHLQIHKLREEVRRGRPQTPTSVEDLIKLVIKRPDAEEICLEAGRRVARRAWEEKAGLTRRTLRLLPAGIRLRRARVAAERLFRRLNGTAWLEIAGRPPVVRMVGAMTVRADPGGAACAVYTGVLEELMGEYTGKPHPVQHHVCEARGGGACEWMPQ
jgi:predicted hydrocarbon binding protein